MPCNYPENRYVLILDLFFQAPAALLPQVCFDQGGQLVKFQRAKRSNC
jgi:hypothetical protein